MIQRLGQQREDNYNEYKQLRGIISELNTREGQQAWCKRPINIQKTTEVARLCDAYEVGAHGEMNARFRHTRGEKEREINPNVDICV